MSTPPNEMTQRLIDSFSEPSSDDGLSELDALLSGKPVAARPSVPLEDDDDRWEITKGVSRGIQQTKALIPAGVGAVADALGFEDFADDRYDEYTQAISEIEEKNAPAVGRVEDIEDMGDFIQWAAGVTGEQIPFIAGALVSGGAGGVAGWIANSAARKGLQGLTHASVKKAAEAAIKKSISKHASTGTFAYASLSGTGEVAGEAIENDLEVDPMLAVGSGAIIGFLEMQPINTLMKAFGMQGGFTSKVMGRIMSSSRAKKTAMMAGLVSGQEAGTETLQALIEDTARSFIDENYELLGEEGRSRIYNSLAAGAVGGSIFGAGAGLLSKTQQKEDDSYLSSLKRKEPKKPEPKPVKEVSLQEAYPFGTIFNQDPAPDIRSAKTLYEEFGMPGKDVSEVIEEEKLSIEELLKSEEERTQAPSKQNSVFSRINIVRGANDIIIIGEKPQVPDPVHGLRTHIQDAQSSTPADMALRSVLETENLQQREANVKALRLLGEKLQKQEIEEGEARAKALIIIERADRQKKARGASARELADPSKIAPRKKRVVKQVTEVQDEVTGQTITETREVEQDVEPVEAETPSQDAPRGFLSEQEASRLDRLMQKEREDGLSDKEYAIVERLLAKQEGENQSRETDDMAALEELFRGPDGEFLRQAVRESKGGKKIPIPERHALAWNEIVSMMKQLPALFGKKGYDANTVVVLYSENGQFELQSFGDASETSVISGNLNTDLETFVYALESQGAASAENASALAQEILSRGGEGAGMVSPKMRNVVAINFDRIESKQDLQKTLLHEMVVHSGLSRLFSPRELTQVLNQIAQIFNFDVIADTYQMDIGNFSQTRSFEGLTAQQAHNVRVVVEEAFARLAEGDPKSTAWQKVLVWIRQMIRRVFPNLKLDQNELRHIVEQTATALRDPVFGESRYRGAVYPYISQVDTKSKPFQKFFTGSSMSRSGRPLLFYHATNMYDIAQTEGNKKWAVQPFDKLAISPYHGVLSMTSNPRDAEGFATAQAYDPTIDRDKQTPIRESGMFFYPIYINAKNPMDFENPEHVKTFIAAWEKVHKTKMKELQRSMVEAGNYDSGLEDAIVLREAGFDGVWTEERGKHFHVLDSSQVMFALDLAPGVKRGSRLTKEAVMRTMAEGPAKTVSDVLFRTTGVQDAHGRDLSEEGVKVLADITNLQNLWKVKAMKLFFTPIQLAKRIELRPVRQYIEEVEKWWNTRMTRIQAASLNTEKWNQLPKGKQDANNLAKALFQISEESDVEGRRLSEQEVEIRLNRLQLSPEAKALYHDIEKSLQDTLNSLEHGIKKNIIWGSVVENSDAAAAAWEEASASPNPSALEDFYNSIENGLGIQLRIHEITKEFEKLRHRNYFPRNRFGRYAITGIATEDTTVDGKKVSKGKIGFFATFENVREQDAAFAEIKQQYPGLNWKLGKLADKEFTFLGMPPSLMESIETRLDLTEDQREVLKEIWIQYGPGRGFMTHMTKRKGVSGYSQDAMRTYASYMLNAAGHLARVEHHAPLTRELQRMNSMAKLKDPYAEGDSSNTADLPVPGGNGVVLGEIRDYFQQHYDYIMHPSSDLAQVRALGFLWYLGANPRSAAVNLTQIPMVTYPWLADRFGDASAVGAITKAYKDVVGSIRGKGDTLEPDLVAAISRGMQDGFLDESLAVDLAGIADAPTLSRIAPESVSARTINKVSYYGAFLFHKAEVFNRRVAFTAAYRLAKNKGLEEAHAYGMAKDAVQSTQFEYAKWNRAAFMRGKKSVLFLFWNYVQQATYLAYGGEGAGTAMRFWGMLLMAAGLQGLPFGDDLMTLTDYLMTKIGEATGDKDPRFSSRELLREMASELGANPDVVMHGAARYYGLGPLHALSALGVPVSNSDVSASLGLGRVVPGTEDLLGKETDPEKRLARTMIEAGGPVVGMGYNFWRLAFEESPDTWKAWERTLPTAAKNLSKAMRFYNRGAETTDGGEEIISFQNRPDRASIIAAQALGFGATDVAKAYEKKFAKREAGLYYQIRRINLLRDLGYAYAVDDREGKADARKAIKRYNQEIHIPELAITSDDIAMSVKSKLIRLRANEMGLPHDKRLRKIYDEVSRGF